MGCSQCYGLLDADIVVNVIASVVNLLLLFLDLHLLNDLLLLRLNNSIAIT